MPRQLKFKSLNSSSSTRVNRLNSSSWIGVNRLNSSNSTRVNIIVLLCVNSIEKEKCTTEMDAKIQPDLMGLQGRHGRMVAHSKSMRSSLVVLCSLGLVVVAMVISSDLMRSGLDDELVDLSPYLLWFFI